MIETIFNAFKSRSDYKLNQVAIQNETPIATLSENLNLPMAALTSQSDVPEIPEVQPLHPDNIICLDRCIENCTPQMEENPDYNVYKLYLRTSSVLNIFSFVIGITTCTYGYPNLGFGLSSKGVCGAIGNFNQCLNEGFPNSNFTLCNIANIDSYILVSCCLLTIDTTNKCKSSIQTRLIEIRNHIEERYSNTENQYPTVEATYPTTEIEQVTDTPDHQNI